MSIEELEKIQRRPISVLVPLCGTVPQGGDLAPAAEKQVWDLRGRIMLVAPRLSTVDLSGPKTGPAPEMAHRPKP